MDFSLAGFEFFAVLGRAVSPLTIPYTREKTGAVLCVNKRIRNGQCYLCVRPKNMVRPGKLVIQAWASPEFLTGKCELVTEDAAREINPRLFEGILEYEESPEYRAKVLPYFQMEVSGGNVRPTTQPLALPQGNGKPVF